MHKQELSFGRGFEVKELLYEFCYCNVVIEKIVVDYLGVGLVEVRERFGFVY